MDRVSQLREEVGGCGDSSLDSTVSPAYVTANEDSSKYFSLSEADTSLSDTSITKDATLTPQNSVAGASTCPDSIQVSNTPSVTNDNDTLNQFNIGKQIEAANILSGGINIFDDNDNSGDGTDLVIDDNAGEVQDDVKLDDTTKDDVDSSKVNVSEPTVTALDTSLNDSESTSNMSKFTPLIGELIESTVSVPQPTITLPKSPATSEPIRIISEPTTSALELSTTITEPVTSISVTTSKVEPLIKVSQPDLVISKLTPEELELKQTLLKSTTVTEPVLVSESNQISSDSVTSSEPSVSEPTSTVSNSNEPQTDSKVLNTPSALREPTASELTSLNTESISTLSEVNQISTTPKDISSESQLSSKISDVTSNISEPISTLPETSKISDSTLTSKITPSVLETTQKTSESSPNGLQSNLELPETTSEKTDVIQDTEVVLMIDGKNVNAIDIGNGLYLYRRQEGTEEELAAVQVLDSDAAQPTFKFLKVR